MTLIKKNTLDTQQILTILTVVYAFVLPLSRAADSLLAALLILIWLFDGKIKNKINFLFQNKVIIAIAVFLFFNIFSLLWSDFPLQGLDYIRTYWHLLPAIVIFHTMKKEYISTALSAFIFGMFISEVISYGVFFEWWEFKYATPENPSPFMHHIEYSLFLAFTALILLGRIFSSESIKYKLLYTFFFISISGNLFLTAGRTGQIAFVLGLFVLALLSFKNKFKALFISFVLSMLVIGAAFNMSDTFNERIITGKDNIVHVIEKQDYCTSWGGRIGAWIVSNDIIKQNPVLGAGLINNMQDFHEIIDSKYPEMKCMHGSFMHVHNQYLQILTQMGFIGFFFLLAIFYMFGSLKIKHDELRKIKYIYITLALFAFMSEVLLHRQFSLSLFALIFGLVLAQHRIENEL